MKTGEEATAVSPSSGFLKTQENTSSNLCKGILSQRTGSGDNKKGANEKEAAEDVGLGKSHYSSVNFECFSVKFKKNFDLEISLSMYTQFLQLLKKMTGLFRFFPPPPKALLAKLFPPPPS